MTVSVRAPSATNSGSSSPSSPDTTSTSRKSSMASTPSRPGASTPASSAQDSSDDTPDTAKKDFAAAATGGQTLICPLDPRSTVFQPSAAATVAHRPAVPATKDTLAHDDPLQGLSLNSLFLQSNASTGTTLGTPSSQVSFAPFPPTPSTSARTSTSVSPTTLYTPLGSYTSDVADHFEPKGSTQVAKGNADTLNSELGVGRYLVISNVPRSANGEQLRRLIKDIAPSFKGLILNHLESKGRVIVAFYDPRDAAKVYNKLHNNTIRFSSVDPLLRLQCVGIPVEQVRQMGNTKEAGWMEMWRDSEPTINVQVHGVYGITVSGMQKCLSGFGDLMQFDHGPVLEANSLSGAERASKSFTAEYYDTRCAAHAARTLDNYAIEGGYLRARLAGDDPFQSEPVQDTRHHIVAPTAGYTLGSAAYTPHIPQSYLPSTMFDQHDGFGHAEPAITAPAFRRTLTSLTERHAEPDMAHMAAQRNTSSTWMWNTGTHANQMNLGGGDSGFHGLREAPPDLASIGRRMSEPGLLQGILNQGFNDVAVRARQRPSLGNHWNQNERQAIPPENRVHPDRILAGLDTRTTIMVKDVPNKLSRQELVNILREVVPGEFDFVYLRFDFNNHCNVGYAFVNFTSTRALYAFIQAKVGRKWNMFSSEKVLQVSYANIQGKSALINKFRNSAVMDVIEDWRPQIFYSNGALKGQPEPFPEADNPGHRHRSASARLSFLAGAPGDPLDRSEYDYSSGPNMYGF